MKRVADFDAADYLDSDAVIAEYLHIWNAAKKLRLGQLRPAGAPRADPLR